MNYLTLKFKNKLVEELYTRMHLDSTKNSKKFVLYVSLAAYLF